MPLVFFQQLFRVCQEEENLIVVQTFKGGCDSHFLMCFLFISIAGICSMQYLSLKGLLSGVFCSCLLYSIISAFSCSFYSFSKYCCCPSIVPKTNWQSVMKEFYFKTWVEVKGELQKMQRAIGSGYLCLLRDRIKYSEHHRDLKKWKEQRESQGETIKVSAD